MDLYAMNPGDQNHVIKTFPNTKCSFCSMEIPEGQGIMLQLCLHSYCRPCLSSSVEQQILSGFNELRCFHVEGNALSSTGPHLACNKIILGFEIKEVVNSSLFEQYTNRELYKAQNQLNQLQKCYSGLCNNFIWIDDKNTQNSFLCPHCNTQNCIKCRVNFGNPSEGKSCRCKLDNVSSGSSGGSNNGDHTGDHDPEAWDKIWQQLCSNLAQPSATTTTVGANAKPLLVTKDIFECPICLSEVLAGDGVMLSECFHSFHKECLAKTIEMSESIQVRCPFVKGTTLCQNFILDREIKAIVSSDVHEKHLMKSVVAAELGCKNSFHCFTINCNGWCEVIDNTLEYFMCPVCKKKNCLKCQTIHENVSCYEYKLKLNLWMSDDKTRTTMEELIRKKEAKMCPQCKILIIKNGGCDHMKCTVCSTDFSWVQADDPTRTTTSFVG